MQIGSNQSAVRFSAVPVNHELDEAESVDEELEVKGEPCLISKAFFKEVKDGLYSPALGALFVKLGLVLEQEAKRTTMLEDDPAHNWVGYQLDWVGIRRSTCGNFLACKTNGLIALAWCEPVERLPEELLVLLPHAVVVIN